MPPRINPDKLLSMLERIYEKLTEAEALSRNHELTERLEWAIGRMELLIQSISSMNASKFVLGEPP